jgi:hypothetical protein
MTFGFLLFFTPSIALAIIAVFVLGLLYFQKHPRLHQRRYFEGQAGAINQLKYGIPQNRRFFKCPSAVTAGMPVLIGTLAAVAIDAYDSTLGGTVFELAGTYGLTVIGQSTQSPVSGLQVNPGDELFASGTLDVPTGVTYNLTIDKTRGNTPFGNLDQSTAILSGVTNTNAAVRLKEGGSGPYAP